MHMPISCSALIDLKIGEPGQLLVNVFKQLLTIINWALTMLVEQKLFYLRNMEVYNFYNLYFIP